MAQSIFLDVKKGYLKTKGIEIKFSLPKEVKIGLTDRVHLKQLPLASEDKEMTLRSVWIEKKSDSSAENKVFFTPDKLSIVKDSTSSLPYQFYVTYDTTNNGSLGDSVPFYICATEDHLQELIGCGNVSPSPSSFSVLSVPPEGGGIEWPSTISDRISVDAALDVWSGSVIAIPKGDGTATLVDSSFEAVDYTDSTALEAAVLCLDEEKSPLVEELNTERLKSPVPVQCEEVSALDQPNQQAILEIEKESLPNFTHTDNFEFLSTPESINVKASIPAPPESLRQNTKLTDSPASVNSSDPSQPSPRSDTTSPRRDTTSPRSDTTSPRRDTTSPRSDTTSPRESLGMTLELVLKNNLKEQKRMLDVYERQLQGKQFEIQSLRSQSDDLREALRIKENEQNSLTEINKALNNQLSLTEGKLAKIEKKYSTLLKNLEVAEHQRKKLQLQLQECIKAKEDADYEAERLAKELMQKMGNEEGKKKRPKSASSTPKDRPNALPLNIKKPSEIPKKEKVVKDVSKQDPVRLAPPPVSSQKRTQRDVRSESPESSPRNKPKLKTHNSEPKEMDSKLSEHWESGSGNTELIKTLSREELQELQHKGNDLETKLFKKGAGGSDCIIPPDDVARLARSLQGHKIEICPRCNKCLIGYETELLRNIHIDFCSGEKK